MAVKEQKLALRQLQKLVIEMIIELEESGIPIDVSEFRSEDFKYSLAYQREIVRVLTLVTDED